MPEKAFESKFNQLVQNELSQKFPAALPDRIGFQLITREELPSGDEKAVGVTALKANDVRAYIPAVFHDNEIKGLDLMWLYEPDLFVPADGRWLERLKETGTQLESIGRPPTDEEDRSSNTPENTIISHSFFLKGKTAEREPSRPMHEASMNSVVDVRAILSGFPGFGTDKTAETLASPDIANTILEKYGETYLYDLMQEIGFAKQAEVMQNTSDPEEAAKVAKLAKVFIISGPDSEGAELLSQSEKKILMKNQAFVKDDRDPASLGKLFRAQPNSSMQVPVCSGLYDLMTNEGKLERCMVIFGKTKKCDGQLGDNTGAGGSGVIVIPLSDPKTAWKLNSSELFGKVLQSVSEKDNVVIGTQANDGIYDRKGMFYIVQPHRWIRMMAQQSSGGKSQNTFSVTMDDGNTSYGCVVRFTGESGNPALINNVLFVPLNARIVSANEDPHKMTNWKSSSTTLFKEAGCKPIRVSRMAGGWQILLDGKPSRVMDKVASLRALSVDLRLYGGDAQMMLKEAERQGHTEYMFKSAAVAVDNTNNLPYQIKEPRKTRSQESGKGLENNASTVKRLQGAAEKGDEDVFELEILKNLLVGTDSTELTKDTLDELTGAMDACGRKLYKMYWETDKLKEEFGAQDIKRQETKLLSLFQELGDVVLDMQEQRR